MSFNLAAIAQDASAIYNLLPVVVTIIGQVESAFPQGGKGQLKLEVARAALEHWYTIAGHTKEQFDALWPTLQVLVNAVVALKK